MADPLFVFVEIDGQTFFWVFLFTYQKESPQNRFFAIIHQRRQFALHQIFEQQKCVKFKADWYFLMLDHIFEEVHAEAFQSSNESTFYRDSVPFAADPGLVGTQRSRFCL